MSNITFHRIYTNFEDRSWEEKPLEGMRLKDLCLGAVSEGSEFPTKKEEMDEITKAKRCNADLAMIASIHPHYFLTWKGTKKFKEPLEEKFQNLMHDVRSLPNNHDLGKDKPISLLTAIVCAKALFLQSETKYHAAAKMRNNHKLILCFGRGHWVKKDDIRGDHAFPSSKIWERLHQVAVAKFPDHFKTDEDKLNRIAWEAHYFDAKNLIGLCDICNKTKGTQLITWLKINPYYGMDFINLISPLTADIVPRTRDGVGLGDAMISHFFKKKNSLTLLADAPLLENSSLVLKELKSVNQLSLADIKRLMEDEENAAIAKKLGKLCKDLAEKLK